MIPPYDTIHAVIKFDISRHALTDALASPCCLLAISTGQEEVENIVCRIKDLCLTLYANPRMYLKRRSCALELSETCCPITLSCFDAHHINEPNF